MTTPTHAASLGAKLDALDLTDDEAALLHEIVAAASGAETVGYGSIGFADLLPKMKPLDAQSQNVFPAFSASGTGNVVGSKEPLPKGNTDSL